MCRLIDDEQARGARRVELYECTGPDCHSFERFPRYNDAFVLFQTRKGRCGEWVNRFAMLCRALGSRVRWIWSAEDHVWVETYSVHRKRWVHVDPCEEAWDKPRLYTDGWGRKLTYCIAFSYDGAMDVTTRYAQSSRHMSPRNRCSEVELLQTLDEITAIRLEEISQEDKTGLEEEHDRESKELRGYIVTDLVHEVCRDISKYVSSGCSDVGSDSSKMLEGKTSGNQEWIRRRNEAG